MTDYLIDLVKHTFDGIGESTYCVILESDRCTVCGSTGPTIESVWLANKEDSILYRYSDGLTLAGAVYSVCFDCHAAAGKNVEFNAAERIRAQLDDALNGSNNFVLEEAHG